MKDSMKFSNYKNLDDTLAFRALKELAPVSLHNSFNAERVENYEIATPLLDREQSTLNYNYAAKQVNKDILRCIQNLSDEQDLTGQYRAVLNGEVMNPGEERRVLHHLSRSQLAADIVHNGQNIRSFYTEQIERIGAFSKAVRSAEILSPAGKAFTRVVQIGIGGSDLGPRALYEALKNLATESRQNAYNTKANGQNLEAQFISNVDPDDSFQVLQAVPAETTLFILVSKSGTTQETLANEAIVLKHLERAGIQSAKKHIVCVTSATSPLARDKDYLDSFFIDDFIGGRYSSTSAVGAVVLSLAFGPALFSELLAGAAAVDAASLNPDTLQNAALLDAAIGVLERNILGYSSTAILPYSQALHRFPAHLQQLDMESNGKRVNRCNKPVNYKTGPLVFGEPGTNGQHSFYQLLHQGTDAIPLQFIGFCTNQSGQDLSIQGSTSTEKLNANLIAQIFAFAQGQKNEDPNKHFPGERPSSLLYAKKLSARVLGALLAHYENKVMFQGFMWNINSFDQEGVQLGKILTKEVLSSQELNPALAALAKKFALR